MRILTNTFDGSRLRHRQARALVTTVTVLLAGYAPLSPAQSSDPSLSSEIPSESPQLRAGQSTLGSAGNDNPQAAHSGPPTYASPEDAVSALLRTVQSDNEQPVRNVLGANSELVTSGDAGADKADRESFVHKYQQMHRLARQSDGGAVRLKGQVGAVATLSIVMAAPPSL
jgi:hypothetical protein